MSFQKKFLTRNKLAMASILLALPLLSLFMSNSPLSRFHDSVQLARLQADCDDEQKFRKSVCLKAYFREYVFRHSAQEALDRAKQLKQEGVIDDCHLSAHHIGEATLEKHDGDVAPAFNSCILGCIEGCYHGVIESYVSHSHRDEDRIHEVAVWCGQIDDSLLKRQCYHGIGHGIMHDGQRSVNVAIEICNTLANDFAKDTCAGGVLMQHVGNHLVLEKDVLAEEIPQICAPVSALNSQELVDLCFNVLGEGFMFYTGHDIAESKQLCTYVPTGYRQQCYKGAEDEGHTNHSNH